MSSLLFRVNTCISISCWGKIDKISEARDLHHNVYLEIGTQEARFAIFAFVFFFFSGGGRGC